MRPIRIEGADPLPLGAPPDWKEEVHGHCTALFIRREVIDGVAFMRSAHEVEAREAFHMFAGAPLHIGIEGNDHPVINLCLGEIPVDHDPVMTMRRTTLPDGTQVARVEMLYPKAEGRTIYAVEPIIGGLAETVATAIIKIEEYARIHGYL